MKYVLTVFGLGALVFAADLSCNRDVADAKTFSIDQQMHATRMVQDETVDPRGSIIWRRDANTQEPLFAAAGASLGDFTTGVLGHPIEPITQTQTFESP